MTRKLMFLSILLLALMASQSAPAQDATTQPDSAALGPKFTSRAYGIELCPPANCAEIHKPTPGTIAVFVQDDRNWQLTLTRQTLDRSLPLTVHNDQFGHPQPGELEKAADDLRQNAPGATLLRNEVINVGRIRVGLLAARYETVTTRQRRLSQFAIFEALDANYQMYYVLEMSSPAKPESEPDDIVNPAEKLASQVFEKVVDSVVLLDRTDVVADQSQRLFNTRSLFVTWTSDHGSLIRNALVPEQWQRIIKDGKDIGYSYITEKMEDNDKAPELSIVRIGIKSRIKSAPDTQWDTQTTMTSTVDHKHESWTIAAKCSGLRGEYIDSLTQIGTSDEQTKAVVQQDQASNGALGQGQVDIATVRALDINTTRRKAQAVNFHREVPVFYIPQAFGFLLPSIVPLQRPHTYLFATFVAGSQDLSGRNPGEIMSRYIDVLPIQDVRFNRNQCQAVQVVDKIGLEGIPTINYFTPAGQFIGSTSTTTEDKKEVTWMVLPTDAQTLRQLWKDPDLTPIDSHPQPQASDASTPAPAPAPDAATGQ